jgi:hypothetical protein
MDVSTPTVTFYPTSTVLKQAPLFLSADQQILPDSTIMLYDMRNLKSSSEPTMTLDFPPGAAFAKIHPMDPSKLVAVSAQGLVRTLDMYGRDTGAGTGYDAAGTDSEVS